MADKKIRNFTTAALAGAYIFPFVKDAVTGDFKCTLTDVVTFVSTNLANITLPTGGALRTGTTNTNTALLQAYNTGGASYTTFGTLTAGATPTFDLSASTTIASNKLVGSSTSTSVDNRLVRYDGTGGNVVQQSGITISDTDGITGVTDLAFTGTTTPGLRVKNLTTAQITALTPAVGDIAYDTTVGQLKGYGPSGWAELNYNVFNVKSYGAKGDGTTDDTAAIQAAVDALKAINSIAAIASDFPAKIVFPCGKYYTTNSIDFTNIKGVSWVIEGNGSAIMAHCTGKPVFDFLHTARYRIRDLMIWGDSTDRPSYGIQMGRGVAGDDGSSANCLIDNLYIDGEFSRSCLYNFAGEQPQFINCWFTNRYNNANCYALILDGNNWENITSAFFTVTLASGTAQSFTQNTFDHCTFRKGGVGANTGSPILLMGEGAMIYFKECYAISVDAPIVVTYKSSGYTDLHLGIHCETTGNTNILKIDNVNPAADFIFKGLRIRDHNPQSNASMIDLTGATRIVALDDCDLYFGSPQSAVPVFGTTSGDPSKLRVSGKIHWESALALSIANAQFNGILYTENATTITHTAGSYEIVRRPTAAAQRVKQLKGIVQVAGAGEGADLTNYVEMEGAATGTAPRITAKGDAAIGLTVIGGSGVASPLTLRSTSGVGTTGADVIFQVGNNGATEAMRILNSALVQVGTGYTASSVLNCGKSNTSTAPTFTIEQASTGDASMQFLLSGVRAWLMGIDNSDSDKFKIASANNGFATAVVFDMTSGGDLTLFGGLALPSTITAPGTTGNQTINKSSGRVNIATAGTTVTVTNSLVTANSIVLAVAATADATARVTNVVPAAGSFVINTVAVTAETAFNFLVVS